jgi:16S rRNA C967 or C1407 C5-methylase (RsmB/RsmF family)
MNVNLRTAGVRCVQTLNDDCLKVSLPVNDIEYILLDPSCSGSGIRYRHDDTDVIDTCRLERLSTLQIRMITWALTEFPRLKRLTYSTCSIYAEENEQVVEQILDQFADDFQVEFDDRCCRHHVFVRCLHSSCSISCRHGQVVDKQQELMHVYVLRPMTH